jgi:hypothetical protein
MANEIYAHYSSGNTLYAVIRDHLCRVWYPQAGVFEDWGQQGRDIADYAVPMTDKSGGLYASDFDDNIPPGFYTLAIFAQGDSVPDSGDEIISSMQIFWSGSGVITAEKLLACRAIQDKLSGQITYYDYDGQTPILTFEPDEDAGSITRMPV